MKISIKLTDSFEKMNEEYCSVIGEVICKMTKDLNGICMYSSLWQIQNSSARVVRSGGGGQAIFWTRIHAPHHLNPPVVNINGVKLK